MSALRKAGVWLGLVEDDDRHRGFDDGADDGVFDDEFGDDEEDFVPARPRSLARPGPRSVPRPADRDHRPSERERLDRERLERERLDREQVGREHAGDRDARAPMWERRHDRDFPAERDHTAERDYRVPERDYPSERDYSPERDYRPTEREHRGAEPQRFDRSGVRPLSRSATSGSGSSPGGASSPGPAHGAGSPGAVGSGRAVSPITTVTTVSYPTQENLALAPQPQRLRERERAVVSDDPGRCYQITTLHPTTYNEARAIGEHFRDGHPVIMNLTEMAESDAKRLVDFAAGLAFGLRGSIERVTNRVFLLSPPNIQVSAEDKARIAEGGFFDQG